MDPQQQVNSRVQLGGSQAAVAPKTPSILSDLEELRTVIITLTEENEIVRTRIENVRVIIPESPETDCPAPPLVPQSQIKSTIENLIDLVRNETTKQRGTFQSIEL